MKSDLKYLIKNSGLTFALRIGGMGLGYVIAILISQFYGAETYGRYSILVNFSLFAIMIFSIGIPTAIVKLSSSPSFHSKNKPLNNYLKKSLIILIISGLTGSLIIYLLKSFLAITIFHDSSLQVYFLYLSLFFTLLVLHRFTNEYFRGSLQFIKYGLFTFILPSFILILILFYLRFTGNQKSELTFLSYLIGFAFIAILGLIYFPWKVNTGQDYQLKNLFRLALPMLFSSAFIFISNWTDIFMLGILVPKADVGIYNAAYKVATLTVIIINVVNIVLGPQIAKLFESKDFSGLKIKVQQATQVVTLLTIPLIIIIIAFRKPLLNLFGDGFLEGEMTLIILSIGMLFNALSGSVSLVLNMTNKQISLRNFTIIAAISNIILNYFLIKNYGIIGAAIATTLTTILLNVLAIIGIKRSFNFYPFSLKLR